MWAEAATLVAGDPRDEAIRLDRSLWAAATEAQQERLVVNPYREGCRRSPNNDEFAVRRIPSLNFSRV